MYMQQQPMMQPVMQPMMQPVMQPMMQPVQPVMMPSYAPPPPTYYPPPQPQQQGPMIINLGNNNNDSGSGSPCPTCAKDTGNIPRKTIGCVTIAWCLVLFFLTGGMAFCYPLCTDSCKDTELVCVRCQTVKSKVPANCCWNRFCCFWFFKVSYESQHISTSSHKLTSLWKWNRFSLEMGLEDLEILIAVLWQ